MAPSNNDSTDPNVPGVTGTHTNNGRGVFGSSTIAPGGNVSGFLGGRDPIFNEPAGAYGESALGSGVFGNSATGTGVHGRADGLAGFGVRGEVTEFCTAAVQGQVFGESGHALAGKFIGDVAVTGHLRVEGDVAVTGHLRADVSGTTAKCIVVDHDPVFNEFAGLYAESDQSGVFGNSDGAGGTGVHARSGGAGGFGVRGEVTGSGGAAVKGQVFGAGPALAGQFIGDVEVTGHIKGGPTTTITCFDVSLSGADCAEHFDIAGPAAVEPGTVMVINEAGTLTRSALAYDKRVAGVISGAGDFKPGIVLDDQQSQRNRQPLALVGKVFCRVDAQYGAVEVGDLLTSSPTPGFAMKAADRDRAFGAVIGKALSSLSGGSAIIPILVALQ